jgi:hypothetical protein
MIPLIFTIFGDMDSAAIAALTAARDDCHGSTSAAA